MAYPVDKRIYPFATCYTLYVWTRTLIFIKNKKNRLDSSATNIFQFLIFSCSIFSDGGCSSGDGGDDGGDDGGGCSSGVHLRMLVGLQL